MATQKITYASSSDLTITLASLATDSNLLTGRESTVVDNTTNLYLDYLVSGKITTGTSPTNAKTIEVWAYASMNDTPLYPDVFDGTDSAETITNTDIKNVALRLIAVMPTTSTSNVSYYFPPTSIAQLYGQMPKKWGVFVTHNTGVNLNATSSNHVISAIGVYATIS